jgi:uncharacterized heparinase superfamily protein
MRKLLLYVRSVRHLKSTQISARLLALLRRRVLYRFKFYTARYLHRETASNQYAPIEFPVEEHAPNSLHGLYSGNFTFLNRSVCSGEPINWFPKRESRLWIYNLHYFDYVVPLGWRFAQLVDKRAYQVFRRLVSEWIHNCPVATPLAWDPYPLSLRITNWIKAYTLFESALRGDVSFATELRRCLHAHACFLEDNIEYDVLGNHLIENGRALLYSGMFFHSPDAERWRRKGERILWRELSEQSLNDGGHYERSPMYHQLMLELYQEVVSVLQLRGYAAPDEVDERVRSMQDWLRAVLHPDGEIPLLNDAAHGIARRPASLLEGVVGAPDWLKALPDSGYFAFRDDPTQNFMIFDCGPLGPDHQPGHGHCDTLSYELSLSGQRFIVDSGVGNYYGELKWRTYYRSTRAHNTVVVDGAEQSEIWNRFRVGRRAQPLDMRWADNDPELAYVCGSHTGYRRLKGDVIHRRWMCWIDRRFWLVCDHLEGQGWHEMESLIHFHPQIQVVNLPKIGAQVQAGEVTCRHITLKVIPWGTQNVSTYFGETEPLQGWYAPEFGLQIKNHVWGLNRSDELPVWFGYILWPETTGVQVQYSIVDDQSCRVQVQSGDVTYDIACGPTAVSLEKKS